MHARMLDTVETHKPGPRPLRPIHTRLPPPPAPPHPQTKDTLTLRASSFGSKCELPDPFLKKVANSGLMDAVMSFASFKANKDLKKSDGAKRSRLTGGRAGDGEAQARQEGVSILAGRVCWGGPP